MNPRSFEYHSPTTLDEALSLVESYGADGKLLAGGQSLIPMMKLRLLSPQHIIDLGRVQGLGYIRKEGGELALGAMTRMAEVAKSELVAEEFPVLRQCALVVADPEVRNMGTVGGNISHGDPANDLPAVMVASGAKLVAASKQGRRAIPASEFFLDTFTTALSEGEILVEARIPFRAGSSGAYVKLERQAGDFAIAAVAALLATDDDGRCTYAGVGLSAVGPRVLEAKKAEKILLGSRLEEPKLAAAAQAASDESDPVGDLRGTADYKREMVKVVAGRALRTALGQRGDR